MTFLSHFVRTPARVLLAGALAAGCAACGDEWKTAYNRAEQLDYNPRPDRVTLRYWPADDKVNYLLTTHMNCRIPEGEFPGMNRGFSLPALPESVSVGDYDNDGPPELVITTTDGIKYVLRQDCGKFSSPEQL